MDIVGFLPVGNFYENMKKKSFFSFKNVLPVGALIRVDPFGSSLSSYKYYAESKSSSLILTFGEHLF